MEDIIIAYNNIEETIIINNTNDINKDNKKEETIINNINWWYPSVNGKKRILWAGTHIHQSNGYSRVMYYITKFLGSYEDIELTIYGFQNFNTCTDVQKVLRCDIHPSVKIYELYTGE